MKLALVQTDLIWEDKHANLAHFSALLNSIDLDTNMIVLPEMFNTGFSMNTSLAENMEDAGVNWMKNETLQRKAMLCGSMMIKEGDKVYNRFMAVWEGEIIHTYDKRHLFRMAGENECFASGNSRESFEFSGWRIRPNVCYDLRFPVWSRNDDKYDIYLNVANWPDRRIHHWNALLAARAIENQCYAIGVNRVGTDGKEIFYSGCSSVIDYNGQSLVCSTQEEILYQQLSKASLLKYRSDFPVSADWDSFQV